MSPTGVERPGAPLVEQQHAEVLKRALEPGGRARRSARGLDAGAALEEHEPRAARVHRSGDLAGEDLDPLPVGLCVVDRNREFVLGEHESGSVIDPLP